MATIHTHPSATRCTDKTGLDGFVEYVLGDGVNARPTDTGKQGILPTVGDAAVKGIGYTFGVAAGLVLLSFGG